MAAVAAANAGSLYACDCKTFRAAVEARLFLAISDAATLRGTGDGTAAQSGDGKSASAESITSSSSSSAMASSSAFRSSSLSLDAAKAGSAMKGTSLEEVLSYPGNPLACPECSVLLLRSVSSCVCVACGNRSHNGAQSRPNWRGKVVEKRFFKSLKIPHVDVVKEADGTQGASPLQRTPTLEWPERVDASAACSPGVVTSEDVSASPGVARNIKQDSNGIVPPVSEYSPQCVSSPTRFAGPNGVTGTQASTTPVGNGISRKKPRPVSSSCNDFFRDLEELDMMSPRVAWTVDASVGSNQQEAVSPPKASPRAPLTAMGEAERFDALFPTLEREESLKILRSTPRPELEDKTEVFISPKPNVASPEVCAELSPQPVDLPDATEKFDGKILDAQECFEPAKPWRRASDFMVGMKKAFEPPSLHGKEGFGSMFVRRWAASNRVAPLPPSVPAPVLPQTFHDLIDLPFVGSPRLRVVPKDERNEDTTLREPTAGQDSCQTVSSPKADVQSPGNRDHADSSDRNENCWVRGTSGDGKGYPFSGVKGGLPSPSERGSSTPREVPRRGSGPFREPGATGSSPLGELGTRGSGGLGDPGAKSKGMAGRRSWSRTKSTPSFPVDERLPEVEPIGSMGLIMTHSRDSEGRGCDNDTLAQLDIEQDSSSDFDPRGGGSMTGESMTQTTQQDSGVGGFTTKLYHAEQRSASASGAASCVRLSEDKPAESLDPWKFDSESMSASSGRTQATEDTVPGRPVVNSEHNAEGGASVSVVAAFEQFSLSSSCRRDSIGSGTTSGSVVHGRFSDAGFFEEKATDFRDPWKVLPCFRVRRPEDGQSEVSGSESTGPVGGSACTDATKHLRAVEASDKASVACGPPSRAAGAGVIGCNGFSQAWEVLKAKTTDAWEPYMGPPQIGSPGTRLGESKRGHVGGVGWPARRSELDDEPLLSVDTANRGLGHMDKMQGVGTGRVSEHLERKGPNILTAEFEALAAASLGSSNVLVQALKGKAKVGQTSRMVAQHGDCLETMGNGFTYNNPAGVIGLRVQDFSAHEWVENGGLNEQEWGPWNGVGAGTNSSSRVLDQSILSETRVTPFWLGGNRGEPVSTLLERSFARGVCVETKRGLLPNGHVKEMRVKEDQERLLRVDEWGDDDGEEWTEFMSGGTGWTAFMSGGAA